MHAAQQLMSAPWQQGLPWQLDARGELLLRGRPLSRVVAAVGGTPCYLYDRSRIEMRVAQLRALLPPELRLHYAVKCNPMPALVGLLAGLSDGLDVASVGELRVALDTGVSPQRISFAGPGKTAADLHQAQAAGILVNVESARELRALAEASAASGEPARVAIRINPPFELKASGMRMGGGPKQFGVDAEAVPALLDEIARLDLAFEGFHLYAGSQNLKAGAIVEAQLRSYELILGWAERLPAPLRSLNLGGGFGIPYTPSEAPLELTPIADSLNALVSRCRSDFPQAQLVLELGRYLVGEAGVYVTRVIDRKRSRDHWFYVCDGGLHHHLAASGNFGQVLRRNYPLMVNAGGTHAELASVVGPLCTPLDLLGDRVELDAAVEGDLIVLFQSGAYGKSASPREFLGHPEVREALV
jgi:diaminopimelate decarboxylase